jgi:succinyl-diaminopimelate desuccinylase
VGSKPAREQTDVELDQKLDAVLAGIDREELIQLARELVRIPSVYRPEEPDGNEASAARFVAGYLERVGFEVQTDEVAPGRPNVWAVWEGNRPGKTLLFEAHTDVVTEGRVEDWGHAPFGGERVGGCVYGRGACDTKGNLAAAVVAVRAIKDSGVPFPGRLVLCHPVDEEGMMSGIKAFVEGDTPRGWTPP